MVRCRILVPLERRKQNSKNSETEKIRKAVTVRFAEDRRYVEVAAEGETAADCTEKEADDEDKNDEEDAEMKDCEKKDEDKDMNELR